MGNWAKQAKERRQSEAPTDENVEEDNRIIVDENTFAPPRNAPLSPIYVPSAQFLSPELNEDDSIHEIKVTTHTTMEVKIIDTLNSFRN